ncbi:MAG: hypothetical protein P8L74_04080 [Gammaproteobacteria bacterium]|nr:hypothetical protein [Gammaproteobacteria bacterium]
MGKKKDGPYKKSQWDSYLGRLTEKGNLKDEKLDGAFEIYYDNDKLHTRGNYKEGIPVGLWENFYENGLLERKTHYNNDGIEEGYFEEYHKNGNVESRGYIKNGEWDGLYETFYKNGQMSTRSSYTYGHLSGDSEYFNESGMPLDFNEYVSYREMLEQELGDQQQEITSLETFEERFILIASYYVFHADNEFYDPKYGEYGRKRTSFIKELHRWRKICGEKKAEEFQHDYFWAGIDQTSEDYEFQGPTFEQKKEYLNRELIIAARNLKEANQESRPLRFSFAIRQIIQITYASGFVHDLEMEALHKVAKLIALNRDDLQNLLNEELGDKFKKTSK